jgi:hypothetical protein
LPNKPAYFRVKIWRRLQAIGAVAVKSTVYALPASEDSREDFEWLLREIVEGGGEAVLCEARLIDGLSDAQARALFDAARDEDYEAIAKEARALSARLEAEETVEARSHIRRLRRRLSEVVAIDPFGASGRLSAEGLIAELEARMSEGMQMTDTPSQASLEPGTDLKGRTWVTREGVHVDRMACSWLIRRFIDPEAVIRFVAAKGYVPKPDELRFDMFEGEVTHEGDRCSFEVLLDRARLNDPALQAIAEIVHDIDLKDAKFGREEAGGVSSLIAGICLSNPRDEQRIIAEGTTVFDNLYRYFRSKRK